MGAHFSWFHLIPPIKDGSIFPFLGEEYRQDAHVFFSASTVCLVLIGLALLARKGLDSARAKHGLEGLVPDTGPTPRNLMEIVATALLDLFTSVLGHKDARRFFPFLAGLFLYILFNNLLSLVPTVWIEPVERASSARRNWLGGGEQLVETPPIARREGAALKSHLLPALVWDRRCMRR